MRYSIGVSASPEELVPMAQVEPTGSLLLGRFAKAWRDRVDGPARRAALAFAAASVFAFAHLARLGSPAARLMSAAAMILILSGLIVRSVASRRAWRDPRKIIRRTIGATDPVLGQRALRAMRLVERTERDRAAGSSELARVHLDRTLARVGYDDVRARAAQVGQLLERAGLLAGGLGLLAVLLGPFRVIEGLDVLVARRGEAPLALQWIDEISLTAHPPDYLRQRDVSAETPSHLELAYGSLLTVRGVPLHAGRKLVLSDGMAEVPFVDDAAGQVVARWPLTSSAKLRVAARFGGVRVVEPSGIEVTSIADEPPSVQLEGAPRILKLLETPEIEVRYQATDDHGLREVHLVLRSGGREERRVLARLDGETRQDRGGHRLLASDRFFKRTFTPIEITVEARDNDPLRGPKWGKSAALTVIPPIVGEPEALRYESLERARDAFVDLTAFRIENELGGKLDGGRLRAHALRESEETHGAISQLEGYMEESFGGLRGLRVSRRIKSLADGQIRKLREMLEREIKRTNQATHAANRKLTEDLTLTLDSVLKRLDVADSVVIAKRLADVADDAAEAAVQARRPSERRQALNRLEVGTTILDGGGGQLLRLGTLGRDLGEIVGNDLKRARRARTTDDYFHAELALRDLAARLRHPAPSFGGGQRGGVEAGGGGGGADSDEDGSEGAQKIAREQEQIEELARDHGAEVSGVEQAMNDAESSEEVDKLRDEARQHAEAVRNAVRGLPRSGGEPSSAEAVASAAREHAEAMADELEHGSIAEAVKSGRNSIGALEQAERAPLDRFSFRGNTHDDAKNAHGKLDPEVKWAEHLLERLRQAASRRAAEDLKKTSPRESNLADRARAIANEGRGASGALPGQTLDLLEGAESAMREAARSLGGAEGAPALDHLKEAQRLLEMARSSDEGEEGDEGAGDERRKANKGDHNGPEGDFDKHAAIPKAEDYKGPEAFRRRVVEGLGGAADPRLREAVQRYAEGLLR